MQKNNKSSKNLEYFEDIIRILHENKVRKLKIDDMEIEFYDSYSNEEEFEEIIN